MRLRYGGKIDLELIFFCCFRVRNLVNAFFFFFLVECLVTAGCDRKMNGDDQENILVAYLALLRSF